MEYDTRAADLVLLGHLHFQEEVERFGSTVLPLVHESEAGAVRTGELTPAGA